MRKHNPLITSLVVNLQLVGQQKQVLVVHQLQSANHRIQVRSFELSHFIGRLANHLPLIHVWSIQRNSIAIHHITHHRHAFLGAPPTSAALCAVIGKRRTLTHAPRVALDIKHFAARNAMTVISFTAAHKDFRGEIRHILPFQNINIEHAIQTPLIPPMAAAHILRNMRTPRLLHSAHGIPGAFQGIKNLTFLQQCIAIQSTTHKHAIIGPLRLLGLETTVSTTTTAIIDCSRRTYNADFIRNRHVFGG